MDSKSDIDKIFHNLGRLAKKHDVAIDLTLDGSRTAGVRLKDKGGKLVARIKIIDLKKALTPELAKLALSLFALKRSSPDKIGIELETGVLKKLFGKVHDSNG